MSDFEIKDDGTIVRKSAQVLSPEDSKEISLYAEYNRLVYEVVGHPNMFSPTELEAKKQRMKEIERSGVQLSDNKALKIKMAQLKVQAQSQNGDNSLAVAIENFKRQNG